VWRADAHMVEVVKAAVHAAPRGIAGGHDTPPNAEATEDAGDGVGLEANAATDHVLHETAAATVTTTATTSMQGSVGVRDSAEATPPRHTTDASRKKLGQLSRLTPTTPMDPAKGGELGHLQVNIADAAMDTGASGVASLAPTACAASKTSAEGAMSSLAEANALPKRPAGRPIPHAAEADGPTSRDEAPSVNSFKRSSRSFKRAAGQLASFWERTTAAPSAALLKHVFFREKIDMSDAGLEARFRAVDVDGSGAITLDEMREYVAALYGSKKRLPTTASKQAQVMLPTIMSAADSDGNSEVDLAEFKALMRTMPDTAKAVSAKSDASADAMPARVPPAKRRPPPPSTRVTCA